MNVLDDFEEFMTEFDAAIDALQIPSRLEQLEELIVEFTTLRREFNETVDDAEAFEVMQKDRKEFNKRSHEIRAFCLRNNPQAASVGSWNTTHAHTTIGAGGSNLRLPKVELPSFDGEVTKWLTFKDRCLAMVHDAAEMPDVVKLQYLLAALKDKVARDFEYVQITAENYLSTWEVLVKRYDNSKTLKREYPRNQIESF
ncbi:uncharacterized protein LOC125959515 [Anopheles darlingi]|uniref:uncharacterized protein LOC125959515 n=1 Tax=Anopheles darlingi TaxID=43151 RepID=UPI0021000EC6|nr:uncharacterized protein LOC125959515 [Anopheles darlingi]